jgi:hydrogenase small subunit
MPGFPDKFMPFMDEPPGSKVSTKATVLYGTVVRALRGVTLHTVDEEPKWRKQGRELTTGYRPQW